MICFTTLLFLISIFGVSPFLIRASEASEERDIDFEILASGDVSGYGEEAYLVVGTDSEWETVWKKHTSIQEPQAPCPEIDFSERIVVCTFMGKCPTSGYSISIERIWIEGEKVHVKVVKRNPAEGLVVAEVITSPYVFALLERTDLGFIFHVVDGGSETEHVLTEFPAVVYALLVFVIFCVVGIVKGRFKFSYVK